MPHSGEGFRGAQSGEAHQVDDPIRGGAFRGRAIRGGPFRGEGPIRAREPMQGGGPFRGGGPHQGGGEASGAGPQIKGKPIREGPFREKTGDHHGEGGLSGEGAHQGRAFREPIPGEKVKPQKSWDAPGGQWHSAVPKALQIDGPENQSSVLRDYIEEWTSVIQKAFLSVVWRPCILSGRNSNKDRVKARSSYN
ncbi:uncharacterized protein LOC134789347 [Penaeus indicus]|uniref:uncharacterized protein LOC134789347 n=1 Tax=Penaeus indicus TaxID=29960 RepID=UPI00300C8406